MTNDFAFKEYERSTTMLLMDFQWIEELLKIVVSASYESIRRSKPAGVGFRPSRKFLEKEALGKLISKYEEVSANETLIAELHSLSSVRNFCAHKSFILSLEEQVNGEFLANESARLVVLHERAKGCINQLQLEVQNFAKILKEEPNITAERDAPQPA